jgi:polar amino acid transport system substrate-binding protein
MFKGATGAAILILLVAIAGLDVGTAQPAPGRAAPDVLRWAGDAEGGAPYVEADPADPSRVTGFDVEIADLLARGLGRQARFVEIAFASIDQSIARGDADIGLSGIEDTPTRRATYAVTVPSVRCSASARLMPNNFVHWRTCAAGAWAPSAGPSPTRSC